MSNKLNGFYYISGGTLPRNNETYVIRDADRELKRFILSESDRSQLCFVLAPRQMGKSSLMVKTISQLPTEKFICIQINLQKLGNVQSERALWRSVLDIMCKQVDVLGSSLSSQLNDTWGKIPDFQPTLQFEDFLVKQILNKIGDRKLVIFVDEIQALINWNLQGEFLGFIRSLAEESNQLSLKRLAFVLVGVAKPSDMEIPGFALNLGEYIEMGTLTGDCEPLLTGLKKVYSDPPSILGMILDWTGGQPFLTQLLCHLVVVDSKNNCDYGAEEIETLVTNKIIKNWRSQDRQSHLQEIENLLMRGDTRQKQQKLSSIRLYGQILNSGSVNFNAENFGQWDLLISGIVKKEDGYLKPTNQIYKQIFDTKWVLEKENFLQEYFMADSLSRIYNRDVFILIDQSASMGLKDTGSNKTRWQQMEELIMGHAGQILNRRPKDDQNTFICEKISVTTFNRRKFRGQIRQISAPEQVRAIFVENNPDANTHIAPALRKCLDVWLKGREKITTQDILAKIATPAFFIIYIDGGFDDFDEFENLLKRTCDQIDDERIVKFIIIGLGLGKDINLDQFDDLEINLKGNKNSNGDDYHLVVFEIEEEMDDIIELMQRHLQDSEDRNNYLENLREGSRHRR